MTDEQARGDILRPLASGVSSMDSSRDFLWILAALINGGDSKANQKRVTSDVMNAPAMRNALQQQDQAPPPVPLSDER